VITSLAIAISKPLTCIYPGCHYVWTGRTPCTGEKKCIRCGTVVATADYSPVDAQRFDLIQTEV
jgi:hypothetical protein